jgi:hypothetical protein
VEIELEHKENSKDSYTCYDDYGAITEPSEAWRDRKVSFSLKGLNGYVVDDKTFLWGKKVYWGIPTHMTMISPNTNLPAAVIDAKSALIEGLNKK